MRRFEHPLEFIGAGAFVAEIAAEIVESGFKLAHAVVVGLVMSVLQ
jgi:hypothetical protein